MKKKLGLFLFGLLALLVVATPVVFAQVGATCGDAGTGTDQGTFMYVLCRIALIINSIIPLLIALAVVYFIWGVVQYVLGKSDDAKSEGRQRMIWGIVGLLVIVTMWGIVAMLQYTFGIGGDTEIDVPCIPSPGITCPQQQP